MPDDGQRMMPPEGFSPPEGFEKFMQQYQTPSSGTQNYPTTPPNGSYPPPQNSYLAPSGGGFYSPLLVEHIRRHWKVLIKCLQQDLTQSQRTQDLLVSIQKHLLVQL